MNELNEQSAVRISSCFMVTADAHPCVIWTHSPRFCYKKSYFAFTPV